MNSPLPASGPAQRGSWTRRLVNVLVALVVIAVAAAVFVFSYDGVHAIALLGGVSVQLARYYPGLFDAVLVIACVAAIMLRDGRWWARLWAWVVIIVILAAIGTTDVLHAMDFTLRHRATEGVVAAAPVVAVLLAFSLLFTMLRQSRTHVAEVPQAAPDAAHAVTEPNEVIAPAAGPAVPPPAASEAPTVEVPALATAPAQDEQAPAQDEPAAPTVQVPALWPGQAVEMPPARGPRGIRYAGNSVPGMARKVQAAEDDAGPSADYWDAEEAGQFAGLVYPVREGHGNLGDAAGSDADVNDAEAGEPAPRKNPPELDDDAPPFATAPFAPVPWLNRVRSTPTPPADEDE
jgi:hypothetical protein